MRIIISLFLTCSVLFSKAQDRGILQDFHPNRSAVLSSSLYKKATTGNDYNVVYQRLELNLNPAYDSMSGAVTTYFQALKNSFVTLRFDLANNMVVDSVTQRGNKIGHVHNNSIVQIVLPKMLNLNDLDSVTVFYHGNPTNNPQNSYGREKGRPLDPHPLIWTLSEPYGAFQWWPCKQGLSDKIDSLDMLVTMPKGNKAAGNGLLISEKIVNDSTITVHWKHRYSIATYLVAVAVTNYDEFTDEVTFKSGRKLPVLNYIFPEYMSSGRDPAKETVRIMLLFDSLFGVYPFINEKYGHAQFLRGGGMEHQTMSFMVDWNFGLVAHELAHQWFGDQITCGSWSDLWLNEGFATYATLLSYDLLLSHQDWIDNNLHSRKRAMESKEGAVFVIDTLDRNRLFSSNLTYNKGAQVLHMLRWLIGDSAFYSGIKNYLNDSKLSYGFAKTGDFKAHVEESSKMDLTEFFDDWIYGEGYPEITAIWHQEGEEVVVQLKQNSFTSGINHYVAPVEILLSSKTDSVYFRLETNAVDTIFRLPLSFNPDSLFVDPNYWVLSKNTVFREADITSNIRLHPNPATNQMRVSYGKQPLNELRIYNAIGQMLYSQKLALGNNQALLDIRFLIPGIYFLETVSDNGTTTMRFVKD